jgi:hypothetical protein
MLRKILRQPFALAYNLWRIVPIAVGIGAAVAGTAVLKSIIMTLKSGKKRCLRKDPHSQKKQLLHQGLTLF